MKYINLKSNYSFILVVVSIGILLSSPSFAKDYSNVAMNIDTNNSNINFATIKKQYIVEPATVENVQGGINNGELLITASLDSIDTMVGIRNDRLKNIYFKIAQHPNISIKANLAKEMLDITGVKRIKDVAFEVMLYGKVKTLKADVIASTTYKGLLVATTQPIIVRASDFGIPADNLTALAKTVGGIALSPTVPVNFVLSFKQ